jgi:tetratricopeptide (TPR) repeat protein
MWPRIFIVTVLCASTWAIPRPETKEQIKRFARLPKIEFTAPLSFSLEAGFVVLPDQGSVQQRLSELRKENKKDGSEGSIFLKMARLHEQVSNRGEAIALYYKSSELLRKKIEVDPENIRGLCDLGEALTALGKFSEAEHYIEQASRLNPKSAMIWAAQGNLDKVRAYRGLVSDEIFYAHYSNFLDALTQLVREGCKPQQIEQAERFLASAAGNLDNAVELDPENPEWLLRRAAFKAFNASLTRAMVLLRGGEATGQSFLQAVFSEEALRDLESAARRSPNATVLGACSMFPIFSCSSDPAAGRPRLFKDRIWDLLSEQKRSQLLENMAGLQKVAESSDEKVAATAFETLGCIQYMALQDEKATEANLRQAIDRNPKQERSWDLLMMLLSNRGRLGELLDLCQDRAEASPSPRNLFLFAKAAERAGEFTKAENALVLALGANQADFLSNLGLANMLMKRADADQFLGKIQDCLTKADRNLGGHPSYQNMLDLAFTKSLYYALSDDLDRARNVLKEWLPRARDNNEITEVLMVLGY